MRGPSHHLQTLSGTSLPSPDTLRDLPTHHLQTRFGIMFYFNQLDIQHQLQLTLHSLSADISYYILISAFFLIPVHFHYLSFLLISFSTVIKF